MSTVKASPKKTAKRTGCLVGGCQSVVYARGLCRSCYQAAAKAVREGTVSADELMGLGLMLPDARGKRSPFGADLAKRLSK
jgi:hypothetical protein